MEFNFSTYAKLNVIDRVYKGTARKAHVIVIVPAVVMVLIVTAPVVALIATVAAPVLIVTVGVLYCHLDMLQSNYQGISQNQLQLL